MTERARGRLPAGTHVGAFHVVRLLAEGGMGRVYEVVDPSIDKPYVIKTLKRDLMGKPEAAERMRLEQRALAELDHPNIVQIITAGEHEGSPYLVMEKLGGATLRQVLARPGVDHDLEDPTSDQLPPQAPIRWEVACVVAIELLEALAVAHAHPLGIVHRDVKPENVFVLDARGRLQVKLVDFGIASLSNSAKQTVGLFRGTPRYAAPEQLRGERVTPATDLYAVGLLLFEMIAGRDPFWEERQLAIGRAHLEKSPPAVSSLLHVSASGPSSPPLPADLDALIARALAKSPGDRPMSAKAFADELRRAVRLIDAAAAKEAEDALLGRIRGAETIASTHDLLAGLGAASANDGNERRRRKLADLANDAAATEIAAPPKMTLAPIESAAPARVDIGQMNIVTAAPKAASSPPRAALVAIGGTLVIAALAFAAGRAGRATESNAPAIVEATATPLPLPTAEIPSAVAAIATDVPSAQPSVVASSSVLPPVLHRAPRSKPVAKPKADVDGVPHVASGL